MKSCYTFCSTANILHRELSEVYCYAGSSATCMTRNPSGKTHAMPDLDTSYYARKWACFGYFRLTASLSTGSLLALLSALFSALFYPAVFHSKSLFGVILC